MIVVIFFILFLATIFAWAGERMLAIFIFEVMLTLAVFWLSFRIFAFLSSQI